MKSIFLVFGIVFCLNASAQLLSPIEDSILVRDGKKLAADIYIPEGEIPRPTILIQTPYNKFWYRFSLPLGYGINIETCPYNFVIVDWRGFYGSASAFSSTASRGEDGYDCVEWIASQSWSDGKIGTWGPSALGKIQFQTAKENPPHLVCCCPLVAGSQFDYEEYYPGGVYRKEYVEQLDALGYGMSGTILANPYYNYLWQYVEAENWYPDEINVPMFMIGGWYDHNVEIMLNLFTGLQNESPSPINAEHKLLMGPWVHGGHGAAYVGSSLQGELSYPAAEGWSDSLALRFFEYYLLNAYNGWPGEPVIRYFQMGEDEWKTCENWPPEGASDINFYLHEGGLLLPELPDETNSSSSFLYNPSDPSPTYGGPTLGEDMLQGPYDQTLIVESRDDIISFTSPAFSEPAVLKGAALVKLFITSDKTDTDFAVRLTDVYPDGRSMLIADGIKRMRFRNGFTAADVSLMSPGTTYEVEIEFYNTAITFPVGHKVRLDISSSNYPRFDKNLNNGGEMYVAGDTLIAENSVFHQIGKESFINLPFVSYALGNSNDLSVARDFRIFPNPSESDFFVESLSNSVKEIEIFTITGENVYTEVFSNNKTFVEVKTTLPAGVYFIGVNGTTCKKLVIY
ncbi:MAG: CocE/NonD family hydrolase [Bacteroidales bacterium]|nr:CocE/NonD family hydrolase [Bacteroidales bacterium]